MLSNQPLPAWAIHTFGSERHIPLHFVVGFVDGFPGVGQFDLRPCIPDTGLEGSVCGQVQGGLWVQEIGHVLTVATFALGGQSYNKIIKKSTYR